MVGRIITWLGIAAIVAGGIVWFSHGTHWYSKDRERIETVVKDELFGTERIEISFRPKYIFGMLPDDLDVARFPNSYIFVIGCGVTAIVIGTFMRRRTVVQF
jgi:hypothetical protein